MVKELGLKNLSSSIQGDQVRVTGKQRDDLQQAIAYLQTGRPGGAPAVHQLSRLARELLSSACQMKLDVVQFVGVKDPIEDQHLEHPENRETE